MIQLDADGRPLIDGDFDTDHSIVLRYRHAFQFESDPEKNECFKDHLCRCSVREGVRIVPLAEYRGVELDVLDESSRMHTTTMRSIDGCVTAARARFHGYSQVVCVSGGNSGTAMTEYCCRAGMETYLFVPAENLSLLNSRVFSQKGAHLIAVEEPGLVKKAAVLFESCTGFRRIPELSWRYEASQMRGLYLLEQLLEGRPYDWLTQTISAAFGPIGVYKILVPFKDRLGRLPRFLGLQQEANCPMFRAWKNRSAQGAAIPFPSTSHLLTRILYDSEPFTYGTFEALQSLLDHVAGELLTVSHHEFDELDERRVRGKRVVEWLASQGIPITTIHGQVLDKTGLMSLLGTLKAIDQGIIAPGSRVLCSLTSGVSDADQNAVPECVIPSAGFAESVQALARRVTG